MQTNRGLICAVAILMLVAGLCLAESWVDYIAAHKPFKVILDKTFNKFNDRIYTGDDRTDPMGNLLGGETYNMRYREDGVWCITGYNQYYGWCLKEDKYPYWNADPKKQNISMWGVVVRFDEQGNVFDNKWGLVGTLVRADDSSPTNLPQQPSAKPKSLATQSNYSGRGGSVTRGH